jgi:hypothetical protein
MMKKNLVIVSLFLAFSLILSACANAAPTQDPGQVATQVAAQVEAQVATRVAQAMAAFNATQKALPTIPPILPTVDLNPTLAPVNLPTLSLPGVPTSVGCNPPPNAMGENYPDGSTLYLNTAFNKSWAIQNAGTCTWNPNYKIKFVSGDAMSGPSFKLFGASVPPGGTITLTLPLKAPSGVGTTTGYWGLYDDKDVYFGRVWVTITAVTVSPTSSSFAVTSVAITGVLSTCTFTAAITTNAGGTVKYHWIIDNVDTGIATDQLVFAGAGTKTSTTKTLPGATTYHVDLYIDIPNRVRYYHTAAFICT